VAEDHLSRHGDVGAAVEALKVELAKAERSGGASTAG
jgi:hypothetical protein